MKGHFYTDEQIQFLARAINTMPYKDMTAAFNSHFGTNLSAHAVRNKCDRTSEIPRKSIQNNYTDEQIKFLTENIAYNDFQTLASMFNFKFGSHLSAGAVKVKCNRNLKIQRRVNPSRINFNFKNKKNIGEDSLSNGYVIVKVNSIHGTKKGREARNQNWIFKQRLIYEQAHGKIQKGSMVIFLDGDKTNFNLENLYAVPRNVGMMLRANKWYSCNPEITLAAVKWCELFYALKRD